MPHPDTTIKQMNERNKKIDALGGDSNSDETTIERLAELSAVKFDQCREEEAEKLGIRVATLDAEVKKARKACLDNTLRGDIADPEPWHDSVDGAVLLDDLVSTIKSYCVLAEGAAEAIALWVLHTYCLAAAIVSPILLINSPEKRCGKTTLLAVLNFLVRRAAPASNISSAVLYRAIEKYQVTLLIDEADSFLVGRRANDELRGVINSGHTRFSAYVWRNEGDDHEPRRFSTWGAKAIALIGNAPDTIMDRAIVVPMRRKMPGESVSRFRIDRPEVFTDLTRKCQRWAVDNAQALKENCEPHLPSELHDRASDNWRPLVAMAELAGWRPKADKAIKALSQAEDDESVRAMLLNDIRQQFENEDAKKLTSGDIVAHLETLTDRPWPEWKNSKPMTQVQLSRLLKPFKIKPKTVRVDGKKTYKGYLREQFDDVFARYAPPTDNRNVTPSQVNGSAGSSGFQSVTEKIDVTDQNALEPLRGNDCYGVTDQNALEGARDDIEETVL